MKSAKRQARWRARDALGLAIWPLELDDEDTARALILAGFITEEEAKKRAACCKALARVVRIWVREILA